jgi:hypothetical protein
MEELPTGTLLKAVGAALHNWSTVEIQLSTLFAALSDIPDQKKAHALFAAILSFEARLAVCDRLMELESLDELHGLMWTKMSARLSKFYKKRHEVAHFTIGYVGDEEVINPFYTQEKWIFGKVRHLTVAQIRERSEKFIQLHMAVGWFANCAFKRRANFPLEKAHALDAGGPPLALQLLLSATQTLEERQQQQQPPPE